MRLLSIILAACADARWLDAHRAAAYRNILLAMLAIVVIGWVLASPHGIDPTGKPLGTDFLSFWTAARLAWSGNPAAAYDVAQHHAAQAAVFGFDPGYAAFFYPPPFLLLCLPLALLPYLPALLLWLAATGTAYVLVVRRWLCGWRGTAATALAFPATFINLGHGQNGFLSAALLGGGLLALRRNAWLGGALLGSLIYKPQLALVVPIALVLRKERRAFIAAGASATLWCAASWLLLGGAAWQGFLADSTLARQTLEQGLVDPAKMQSLFAAVRLLGGGVGLAYGLQAALAAGVILLLCQLARRRVAIPAQDAATVCAALLLSPFLLDYDLTLLALPLAWLFGDARARSFLPWEKLLLLIGFLMPLVSRNIALATGVPIGAPVLIALLLACSRTGLRSSPSRRSHAASGR